MSETFLKKERTGSRLKLTLARPEIRHARNDALIDALVDAVTKVDEEVRVIILAGEGKSFCAGADLNWMRGIVEGTLEENKADARRLVRLLDAIVDTPRPVIARVHGAALGGGMGLVAACDLVVAHPQAILGLTEVRLGLAPAMIFPYLLRKVPRHELLAAALLGERFDGARGKTLGLVNEVSEDVDAVIDTWCEVLARCGPKALGAVKTLFTEVPRLSREGAVDFTVDLIAALRVSAEGQEGMRAFLDKRPSTWASKVAL